MKVLKKKSHPAFSLVKRLLGKTRPCFFFPPSAPGRSGANEGGIFAGPRIPSAPFSDQKIPMLNEDPIILYLLAIGGVVKQKDMKTWGDWERFLGRPLRLMRVQRQCLAARREMV